MIYFDNAATTGHKPESVVRAVSGALVNLSANPGRGGYATSEKASLKVFECRKKVADMFGASGPERVIFTANCTTAINFVLKGILEKGDHVITSCLEHNAVARPLYRLSQLGVEVDYAEVVFEDKEAIVRSFERLVKPNTKMIICTHASNVTGHLMPIAEIGSLCKKRGILFAVDAAQTAGIVPINMNEMCIDYLCIAPHKALYAPMGTGILIANKDIPKTVIEGGTGTMSVSTSQPAELPEKFESGTVNLVGIAGISAGIDFVNRKGIEKISKYEMNLAKKFYNGLKSVNGIVVYSPYPNENQTVPTISFNIKGINSVDLANMLGKDNIAVRAGLHCAPMAHKRIGTMEIGTVRVCFSVFNMEWEVENLLNVLKKISKNRKIYY